MIQSRQMAEGEPKFKGFKAGQTFKASRKEIIADSGENLERDERAFLECLQRLAILPKIEGLALSQIKMHGGPYFTVIEIERDAFSGDEEAAQTFARATDALYDFGDAIDQIMPGSFITLNGRAPFGEAVRILKREKRRGGELDLLGILHFVE